MRAPHTSLLPTATGEVEYLVTRTGAPVTVYAHGLLGSIDEARTLASGVAGTAAFLSFRGHGRTRATDGRWDYAGLAAELSAVSDHVAATQAVGMSLGSGALLRLLSADPHRFTRVVLMLPAAVDVVRTDRAIWRSLAGRVVAGDVAGVARSMLSGQPPQVRDVDEAREHYRRAAQELVDGPAETLRALRTLPFATPVDDRASLRAIDVPVLVVSQRDDPLHPLAVGEELAGLLPAARLHVLARPGEMWLGRRELREVLTGFLASG
ncbi:MAG: alpha/beta hydrolase [Streptosporangiales bacterium]|nr:alpha/beta hydrolase [Streptosporangiales bacterium]